MTALYLRYLWESTTWHQAAEAGGLVSYGMDTPGWVTLQPSSPGDAAQAAASRGRLREKQLQEGGGGGH